MCYCQNARLEESLRVFNLPISAALQEFSVPPIDVKRQPVSLITYARNFLMGVSDVVEVQPPVFMCLIGQVLWLTTDGKYLTARGSNLFDHTRINVAPQLGATGGSPKSAIKEQHHERVLRHNTVQPSQASTGRWVELCLGFP